MDRIDLLQSSKTSAFDIEKKSAEKCVKCYKESMVKIKIIFHPGFNLSRSYWVYHPVCLFDEKYQASCHLTLTVLKLLLCHKIQAVCEISQFT